VRSRDSDTNRRIDALDSIRFVAAFWVAMSHGALPLRDVSSAPLLRAFSSSFDGVSAVMVFFIVSGFCIHLPYVDAHKLPVVKFILRRYVRIGLPLIAILLVMHFLGGNASKGGHAVLWSVYAEIVYYTLYPLLFALARRFGWGVLITIVGIISSTLALTHITYLRMWEFGSLTWLWGLPIWLSGCVLAARFRKGDLVKAYGSIWFWRLAAWFLGAAAGLLIYSHAKIGYPVSMLPFAFFAFFWLTMELQNAASTWQCLQHFGSASYSLYLVHAVVLGAIDDYLKPLSGVAIAIVLPWAAIAAATYLFYRIIEAPSHLLARWAASRVSDFFSGQTRREAPPRRSAFPSPSTRPPPA
jgi:peptidoglycan/LPS O-acetylase OafA/YrhL